MARIFRQFLGSKPGSDVELIDDSSSPYRIKRTDGFEYTISADDFANYYKPADDKTPHKWAHLITDPENGTVHTGAMRKVVDLVESFLPDFKDFFKARAFVREALKILNNDRKANRKKIAKKLEENGWNQDALTNEGLAALKNVEEDTRRLLLDEICASIQFPELHASLAEQGGPDGPDAPDSGPKKKAAAGKGGSKKTPAIKKIKTKNVDMSVDGEMLTIVVDMSKEFGPSKSGKTIIVASTEGNKTIPGRSEKIGLNIYKQEKKKPSVGRKDEFKNVKMRLEGEILTITVDLSQELGDSKSGKTIIIGTTGGNQLVLGKEEKIGLNVYRNKD